MTGAPERLPLARDAAFWLLAFLCALDAAWLGAHLVYPDLNLAYPFMGGDGYDWIANGLALGGAEVRWSGRQPLLPLLLAGLDRLGALPWFPVVNVVLARAAALGLYAYLVTLHSRRVSLVASLFLLTCCSWRLMALEVMADTLAATLLLGCVLAFSRSRERPRWYLAAGALGGLSAVTQQAAPLLVLPIVLAVVARRRADLRRWEPWVGVGLFLVPGGAWWLWRRFALGGAGIVGTGQWALLAPHLDAIDFYAAALLSFAGVPVVALALAGGWLAWRRRNADGLFLVGAVATLLTFFAIVYAWEAKRFVSYAVLPALPLVAAALASLERRRAVFWATGIAALVWASWPLPQEGRAETRWLLWPFPTMSVEAGAPGLHVRHLPLRDVVSQTAGSQVLDSWRKRAPVERIDPERYAADRSVVYLYTTSTVAARDRTTGRLGNAVRKRVKYVAQSLYPERWWGWRTLTFVEERDAYALFRVGLPAPGTTTIVAVDRRDPLAQRLRRLPLDALSAVPKRWQAAAALALEVDGSVTTPDGLLATFEEHGPRAEWLRLVPFVVRTAGLYVIETSEAGETSRLLAGGAVVRRIGDLEVRRTSYQGWPVVVVERVD